MYEKDDDIDVKFAIDMTIGREVPRPTASALERHFMELLEKNATGAQEDDPIVTVQEFVEEPKRGSHDECRMSC